MRKYWNTASSDDFTTSTGWTPSGVPGPGDFVILNAPGIDYTVGAIGTFTVLAVSTAANATLDINNTGAGFFQIVQGTASGKNLGTIQVQTGSTLELGGVFNNPGTIQTVGTSSGALLSLVDDTTLKGGGNLFLSDTTQNIIFGFPHTLTNVDNLIAGAGSIEVDLVNGLDGVVEATSGANPLTLGGNPHRESFITNSGTLEGAGSAGLVIDHSVVTNTGGFISAVSAFSRVELKQTTKIIGGTLFGDGVIVANDAILDGSGAHPITIDALVTNVGNLSVQGVIANHGTLDLQTAGSLFLGLGGKPAVDTTLKGGGAVTIEDEVIDLAPGTIVSKPVTFTNVDNVISGYGDFGPTSFGSLVLNNQGTVDADGGGSLIFDCNITNSHLLEATNDGALFLNGVTVTNTTGGIISAEPNAIVVIHGDVVKGGTLSGTGSFQIEDGTILDGSTAPLTNDAVLVLSDVNTAMTLKGTIVNVDAIQFGLATTVLAIGSAGTLKKVTLTGGGDVNMSMTGNSISGTGSPTTLHNVNNTIAGAGKIGGNGLILNNSGTIEAKVPAANQGDLVIDTGANVVINSGLLAADLTGSLYIASAVTNTGTLGASNGTIVARAAVTGGSAKLDAGGQIEFDAASTTAVRFDDNSVSSLVLGNSVHFKGVISNFGKLNTGQSIDLLDIASGSATFTAGSPNKLTVTDGTHTAVLKFSGSYTAGNFHLSDDGHGGTLITDPPVASHASAALLFAHMASSFAAPSAGFGGSAGAELQPLIQPLLAPSHG